MTQRSLFAAVVSCALAACATPTPPPAAPPARPAATAAPAAPAPVRQTVTRADQLPRTTLALPALPSELFTLEPARLKPLLDALEASLRDETERFAVSDRATLDGYDATRVTIAMLRGDWAAVAPRVRDWRARQDKPAAQLTAAQLNATAALARASGGDLATQRRVFRERFAAQVQALPFDVTGNTLRAQKGSLEIASAVVTVAGVRSRLDPVARNNAMQLDARGVAGVLSQRVYLDHVLPFREEAVAVLAAFIAQHDKPIADTWTPRTFALKPDAPGKPVVIGVWDGGVDPALFRMASPVAGLGFDLESRPEPGLLQPLGDWAAEWPKVKGFLRGSRDVLANIDSPEASAYRRHVAALAADEVQPFQESLRRGGNHYHGTHVAGIAVDGNPFARVFAARTTYAWRNAPLAVTDERRERGKAASREMVAALRAAGARVVNMSFGGNQRGWEAALQYHGVGKDANERRALARRYYTEHRNAFRDALASAPEILFITSAGNANADSGFEETYPADITLPNLMTIGAVDSAGNETSFSSFGRTTVAHANGYQVESFMPGGERLRASGTSMAAPQVANLAAKLWALYPDLTVAEVKQLILDGAEKNGRVNLVHPRRTLALAAALRPAGPQPAAVVVAAGR
jgi:subtilisin family serine protease